MLKANCGTCGSDYPSGEMLALQNKPICKPCAEKQVREAAAGDYKLPFARLIDPTICGLCKTDYGSGELPFVGGSPVCANCSQGLYERPYPAWLRLSLAGLLLLLAGSLWQGVPYFRAGRHLVLAERAMDHNDYRKASLQFAEVLKISPTSQEVVLKGAKASLMAGDMMQAQKFLKLRQQYKQDALFTEVNNFWNRGLNAYQKEASAAKLAQENKDEEAAQLMHQASNEYPQSEELAGWAQTMDGHVAFDRKDYDTFLRLTQAALAKTPNDPGAEGFVASALACKYAVTGDPEFRRQTEELLARAQMHAQKSPEEMARFQEYAERIRYRLDSREIIDKAEYDRRFRQKEAKR
jgi:hypothetical protein